MYDVKTQYVHTCRYKFATSEVVKSLSRANLLICTQHTRDDTLHVTMYVCKYVPVTLLI